MQIHPTALVEPGARIAEGCVIHAHALISRHCELAAGVIVHPFAVIGGDPQDLKFDTATLTGVRIGARTVIREYVTISRATHPGGVTEIGSDCFLMAASHVAHDCVIGDRVVLANVVMLAGHVHVGDGVFMGGGAMVHQFCRIGEGAMIGGGAHISLDIAPFYRVAKRNQVSGLNVVGLRRRGIPRDALDELKRAYHLLSVPVGNLRDKASAALERQEFASAEALTLLQFFQGGRRGFARAHRGSQRDATDSG